MVNPSRPGSRVRLAQRALVLVVLGVAVSSVALVLWREGVPSARDFLAAQRVEKHTDVIGAAAEESRVDPYLLAGLMFAESSGRVSVKSSKGALGLFQLMPATAREQADELGLPEPTEEELLSDRLLNARLGASYMSWLLDMCGGNVERALVAYNTGPGRLSRWTSEAGSYEAWRAERVAAGDSDVLAYANKVLSYTERFRNRGWFEGPISEDGRGR